MGNTSVSEGGILPGLQKGAITNVSEGGILPDLQKGAITSLSEGGIPVHSLGRAAGGGTVCRKNQESGLADLQ